MKPSHMSTPRTMADSTFQVGYPTLYRYERQARRADVLMAVVCAVAVVLMLWGVI